MKKKRNKLIDSIVEIWQGNRFLVRPFLVMCTIYLLGISAIILAGVHYADDVARTNYGYAGWSGFSRYLSTILAHGLHADNYLTNIAPLPQILAVAVLAAASIMMICIVSGKEIFKEYWTKWIWRVVAVVPLGLCPYMLECLSYQYDAIYMAMSVFFATWPLIFRRQSKVLYAMMIVMGILIVCTTYQVSIGIYPMLVIFITMKEWSEKKKINNKENWAFLLLSAVVFSLTVVVFQKFLMIPRDVYASNVVPGIGEFLPEFFAHLGQYFSLLVSDFKILWLVLIGIIGISFVVLFVIKSRRNKFMATVVALVGVVLMAVMAYALYAALDKPLYTTRAMYAIGAFVAIMGIYIVSGLEKNKIWNILTITPVIVLAWCFFVFGFTYGNALKEQNEYRDNQVKMVTSDLNELLISMGNGAKVIQVNGQIGFTPVVAHMPERDYRILRRLLGPSFVEYVPWMAYKITQESGMDNLVYEPEVDLTEQDLPILKDTVFYKIYGNEKGVLVEFKVEDLGLGI